MFVLLGLLSLEMGGFVLCTFDGGFVQEWKGTICMLGSRRSSPEVGLSRVEAGGCNVRWGPIVLRRAEDLASISLRAAALVLFDD